MAEDKAFISISELNINANASVTQTKDAFIPWQYLVSMPQPENHLFHLQLTIAGWHHGYLDLRMPVWTPGSYLVREYAKQLQEFAVTDSNSKALDWDRVSKNHWRIDTANLAGSDILIKYKIFANELTVRTNHLDGSHGFFNGAAMFMFGSGCEQQPYTVEIVLPRKEWAIATALPPVPEQPNTFLAENFDTLADSPFEIGIHSRHEFSVLGKPHALVIWGEGNPNPEQIVKDTAVIIAKSAEIFGGLPYERYLFLLHLSATSNGGLEHKDCCTLNYQRLGFRKDNYLRFMNLVAHEFFHVWNVKRIRPKALEKFDYDRENYTTSLWFCEGTTSYYDHIIPLRSRLYDARHVLKLIGESITRLQTTPGRLVQTLAESSLESWIKLYRADANSQNSQISYYLKGELVSMLLDLLIRDLTQNRRCLDDVMRLMWQYFGKTETGFTEAELYAIVNSVAGKDLQTFFQTYLHTTAELDYNYYLEPFGLKVESAALQDYPPYTGMVVKSASNSPNAMQSVRFVEANSPAQLAGINPGDELLAMNGVRVTAEALPERLRDFAPGDVIELTLFMQDRLNTVNLVLGEPVSDRYNLVPYTDLSPAQRDNFHNWLPV